MDKVINTYHTFVKKKTTNVWQYVLRNDKRKAEAKQTKQFENSSDDDWVLDFDMDKVVRAYHSSENQKPGLDKSLEENEVFVPPPEQLKEPGDKKKRKENHEIQNLSILI